MNSVNDQQDWRNRWSERDWRVLTFVPWLNGGGTSGQEWNAHCGKRWPCRSVRLCKCFLDHGWYEIYNIGWLLFIWGLRLVTWAWLNASLLPLYIVRYFKVLGILRNRATVRFHVNKSWSAVSGESLLHATEAELQLVEGNQQPWAHAAFGQSSTTLKVNLSGDCWTQTLGQSVTWSGLIKVPLKA